MEVTALLMGASGADVTRQTNAAGYALAEYASEETIVRNSSRQALSLTRCLGRQEAWRYPWRAKRLLRTVYLAGFLLSEPAA
jgi:hypothetical protein